MFNKKLSGDKEALRRKRKTLLPRKRDIVIEKKKRNIANSLWR